MTGICCGCYGRHALRLDGTIRGHGPSRDACPGSYLPPVALTEAARPAQQPAYWTTRVRRARAGL